MNNTNEISNDNITAASPSTFEEYNYALCYGAGGAWYSPQEIALCQDYWDHMVLHWNPKVVEAFGHLVDKGLWNERDQLERGLPDAVQFAHALNPNSDGIARTDYSQWSDEVSEYAYACLRYLRLTNAAWELV